MSPVLLSRVSTVQGVASLASFRRNFLLGDGSKTYVDDVFNTYLYEGTGASLTITNGIDLAGEGGMVWFKSRSSAREHNVLDTERGARNNLVTNADYAEFTGAAPGSGLLSFNSDGFSLGSDLNGENQQFQDTVSWTFRKAPGFFDVVTWTGNGSTQTLNHSLGSVPGTIIVKQTNAAIDWVVYHRSLGNTKFLLLNSTAASDTDTFVWNSTTPTSTTFTVGPIDNVNKSGGTYVAYLFAHDDQSFGTDSDEAVIKCGSYTGTGSAGNFVNLGWEPQWLLVKNYTTAGSHNWFMGDIMRGIATGSSDAYLQANLSDAEGTTDWVDVNPTGFTLNATGDQVNGGTSSYIYVAIRRPHKPPTDATEVFDTNLVTTGTPTTTFTSGFVTDAIIYPFRTLGAGPRVSSRLTGNPYLDTSSNGAEGGTTTNWDSMTGVEISSSPGNSLVDYMFRRAPGFFDVLAYTGTGLSTTRNHGLGVAPELTITKVRNQTQDWGVLVLTDPSTNSHGIGYLNKTDNITFYTGATNVISSYSSTQITLGNSFVWNNAGDDYVTYLFATLPGISKVGSYTGTGSDINVDCGFTAGARFVLIKRTDGGNWYVWDTARGIISGIDPYLLFNSSAAEVATNDSIDPLNAGFTVTSSAPVNSSGGTYIFLAIA